MFKRRSFLLVLLTMLTACAFGKVPDPNGKMVFALGGEISILNPILSADSASSSVQGPIFNGLTKINEKLEIVPDLAQRWTVSKDGKVFTFYLRKDVLWHDGKQFTAKDVKFTFDSILDPKVNSVRRSDYIIDGKPIRFKVIDPYTVEAVLPRPFAPFLASAGMSILPEHLLKGKDLNTSGFNQKPVGTGPFKFKEWVASDHASLVRNEKYHLGAPLLSGLIYRIIPDENSRLIALEAGQIDESDVPPREIDRIKRLKGLNVYEYEALTYTYLGFNLANPVFSDKRVRQALAYATDKKQLINLIFMGTASPAYSPFSPVSWVYENKVEKYPFDRKRAEKLLEEAGWKKGSDGTRKKGSKPLEFTILVNQGNKEREKAAVILQWQYKKIGAKVNVRVMEWSAMLRILNASKDPKDFDAVIIGWSLGIDPDQYSIWHSSQYPSGLNFVKYKDPKIDGLLEKGRTTMDREGRKQVYSQLQKMIAADQPYIFLWYPKTVVAVSKKAGGLSKPGPAGLFLNIEKVFVTK